MSHSQKHSGKVFVPWYNTAEWKSIYAMLTAETRDKYEESLKIMRIWKIRTPLLSAGVEGTIIIMEAILFDELNSSDTQMRQIYAISLLRFLNICAANSDKQGAFNRTVTKNDLPRWLIDIRHDIAHDHRLPSKSLLKLALQESLKWLMEKYWKVQNDMISDYIITDESVNTKIIETLNTYIKLKMNVFSEVPMDEYNGALVENINNLIYKRYNMPKTDINGILDILEEILKQSLCQPENENIGEKLAQILVSDQAMLSIHLKSMLEVVEILPREFRDIWSNLLNIMFENGFLFQLMNQLLQVTNNMMLDNVYRRLASLWITEIFNSLLKLQAIVEELECIMKENSEELDTRTSKIILKTVLNQKNPEYKNCLEFESTDKLPSDEAKSFEENVLKMPNEYTLNFLERVMIFNKNSQDCIEDTKKIVNSLTSTNNAIVICNGDILTINDLEHPSNPEENGYNSSVEEPAPLIEKVGINGREEKRVPKRRWTVIKDTSLFRGCPLGVLPHQNRAENPLL
ncbi:hypothetical protein JTB14_032253 [Gonioctena quinquepunctata]|nr:hypothetical protein JTB14_032253 [Gonioctena quinquepunctata]